MLADVFGVPVITTNAVESGAFGAALLAASGTGAFANVTEASDRWIAEAGRTEPRSGQAYVAAYEVYRGLHGKLKDTFASLAEMGQEA
jgi:xylulokinase